MTIRLSIFVAFGLLVGPASHIIAGGQPAAPMPLKVFISADMEGVAGVVQPPELGPDGFDYGRARERMTQEVLRAIEAARQAGATEFVVADAHGNHQNLLIDRFPEDVRLVRGAPRPLRMMQGIDETFGAVLMLGFHGSEFAENAVRGHTFSSAKLLGVRLNGMEVSEGIFNAAIAGHFGVPVVFVSGDRTTVEQLQAVVPLVEGAIVKEAFGYHSALTVTPITARELIREGVTRALQKRPQIAPYQIARPIELTVGFKQTIDAEIASNIPGLRRVDAHTVAGTFADMLHVAKVLLAMTSLE